MTFILNDIDLHMTLNTSIQLNYVNFNILLIWASSNDLKLDLDIVKMYVCTQNEASTINDSKVIAWTDRQTDSTEIITCPHTQMVNMGIHY